MGTKEVVLSLGGNIGDTKKIFSLALDKICEIKRVTDFRCSRLYKTSPVSCDISQRDFLNICVFFRIDTDLKNLFKNLKKIEFLLGKRTSTIKNLPRTIDIDIIESSSKKYFIETKIQQGKFDDIEYSTKGFIDDELIDEYTYSF